ncbi:DUF3306 domain-containing protein [Neptuniibacter sp.]|uniref:DUF3306 domain-containing protein n=1 Tax=Neptuniibacter sp. TaxID=1962643 RepID=UPI0026373991|nr:DUF3306 domain-containing protein [Neptuniibacter sp.]MCP4595547.1 DUF3306 domain-containing protein [Neptuniibacter sp.]
MDDKQSFFSRWSQRKAEQRETDPSTDEAVEVADSVIVEADENEEVILTDEDMPDIESLDQDSDYGQFFSTGVSDELRDLALQKLFRLPEFNLRDGLNDYDEDFSKMPELAEAVVAKLRNWVNEKEEDLKEELTEQITGSESDNEEPLPNETTSQTEQQQDFSDLEEDDLGDADLDG